MLIEDILHVVVTGGKRIPSYWFFKSDRLLVRGICGELSDDKCWLPVKINSKILIGSQTAKLVDYNNTACREK